MFPFQRERMADHGILAESKAGRAKWRVRCQHMLFFASKAKLPCQQCFFIDFQIARNALPPIIPLYGTILSLAEEFRILCKWLANGAPCAIMLEAHFCLQMFPVERYKKAHYSLQMKSDSFFMQDCIFPLAHRFPLSKRKRKKTGLNACGYNAAICLHPSQSS
jgi:hypothetical protein